MVRQEQELIINKLGQPYNMQKEQEHPFVSHRGHFERIPNQQRSEYRKRILDIKQLEGEPKLFKTQYQNKDTWIYNNQYKLNYYFAKQSSQNQPKAIFFSLHGLNSHGGSSGYLGTNIAKYCSVDVYSLDFKNFGLSEGPMRGLIASFEEEIHQAQTFVDFIMDKYKNCKQKPKVIISGLSFGGTICFKMAIRNPSKYDYIAFLAPGLRQVPESLPIMKQVGKAIGYLFPTFQFIEPKFTDGTKYKMQKLIRADERNYTGKVVPGSVRTVLNAMDQISKQFGQLTTPYILIQAGADKMVDVFAPLDLQRQSKTEDKITIFCKDMWHSVYSEEEMEHIVPIIIKWIQKRIN